jgi:HlyD family secretion protein
MKVIKKIVIILFLAAVGIAVWEFFPKEKNQEFVLYGNVDQRQVELAFIDSERVAEVIAQEGMEVQAGEVVARLETRRLKDKIAVLEAQAAAAEATLAKLENGARPEEIEQAKAAVDSANAEVTFADAQYERYHSVFEKSNSKAMSKQDVDNALRQRNVARAKLKLEQESLQLARLGSRAEDIAEAQAILLERRLNLRQLRNQLEDAELKSPVRAVVNRRLMEPGDIASPERAIFSLSISSPKWVRAYVSELYLGRVRPGMEALVYVDSYPNEAIPGKVGFISSVAEFTPKTVETQELRTSLVYEVRVIVEDTRDRLRAGMPATVRFPAADGLSSRAAPR